MTVVERRLGNVTVLDLAGRLVFGEGVAVLRAHINEIVDQGRLNIVLNLRDVTYIDSSGIGELVSAYTAVRKEGGELKLLNLLTAGTQRVGQCIV